MAEQRQVRLRVHDPVQIQVQMMRGIKRLVLGAMREEIGRHLLPAIERWGTAHDQAGLRDDLGSIEIERIIREMQFKLGSVVDSPELRAMLAKVSEKTNTFNAAAQKSLLEQVVAAHRFSAVVPAINVFIENPYLAAARDEFVTRNVALIRTLPQESFGQIGKIVTEGMESGLRPSQIAIDLQERLGVAESRAQLIARDQVLKFNGELASVRQQSVGVTHFTWYTSLDRRVRPSHKAVHNKQFAWASPPVVDGSPSVPGQPIQCRCNALPFLG